MLFNFFLNTEADSRAKNMYTYIHICINWKYFDIPLGKLKYIEK